MGRFSLLARRRIPLGFLGMLALIGAVERHSRRHNLALTDGVSICWHYTDKFAREKATTPDLLCLGDSMMQFGMNPRILEEGTGRSTRNLTLMGGSSASTYFLLRHALESGARPSTVLVNFGAHLLPLPPISEKSAPPWHQVLTLRDSVEFCWVARDPEFLARTIFNRLLPSLRNRPGIRSAVMEAFKGGVPAELDGRRATVRNLHRNEGALVRAKAGFRDVPTPPEAARMTSQWQPTGVNAHFVRKFFALAEEHRIRVYWILFPQSPGQQAKERLVGTEWRFEEFVRLTARDHDNLRIIDARHLNLAKECFYDERHLNRDGMQAVSVAVVELLNRDRKQPIAPGRWIELAGPQGPARASLPLEDMDQSLIAVRTLSDANSKIRR